MENDPITNATSSRKLLAKKKPSSREWSAAAICTCAGNDAATFVVGVLLSVGVSVALNVFQGHTNRQQCWCCVECAINHERDVPEE